MSNYVEYGNKVAFHPGYYIKEYIDEVGLTQEEFANRLGTTPKNISYIIRGEQSLSVDIAYKLSRLIGTSAIYWLNLQSQYDLIVYEINSYLEALEERKILKEIKYSYFRDNFDLPDIPKKTDEQIENIRIFLNISSLTVLRNKDMCVRFRSASLNIPEVSLIKANVMVQIATNMSKKNDDIPKYDRNKFEKAVNYALTLTTKHDTFLPLIKKAFYDAGVDLIILPNIPGSKTNGATKKIDNHIMLMVNDRNNYADSFWFTLFHEIGHIINGDFGISFENESDEKEDKADCYAEDMLIPPSEYNKFIVKRLFTVSSIISFAKKINRDSGIVLGRLQNDGFVEYSDYHFKTLKKKYYISIKGNNN